MNKFLSLLKNIFLVFSIFLFPFIISVFNEDIGLILFTINFIFIPVVLFLMLRKKTKNKISKIEESVNNQISKKESFGEPIQFDFSVIDFETANLGMDSACSIGIVGVRNNEVMDEYYSHIKPRQLRVNKKNFEIHGISEEELVDAPSFEDIWYEISRFIENSKYVVAHNAQFDMSVLTEAAKINNIEVKDFNFVCSINLCKQYTEQTGNSLDAICKYYEIENNNHHNALSDAKSAALCVIKTIQKSKHHSFEKLVNNDTKIRIKKFKDLKSNKTFDGSRKFNPVKISDIKVTNFDINKEHHFFEKTIVFTGEFENHTRAEMIQIALNVGCIVRDSVSRKTNYLVVGKQDISIVGEDGLSGKQEKAIILKEQGYDINMLDETEFMNLITAKKPSKI